MGMLIILSGLPGVGKTAIARELAGQIAAVHLRIDSIEQALRDSGVCEVGELGYRIAYTVAEDNLRLGHTVIADCVNPIQVTRDSWREVAARARAKAFDVEISCSDPARHQERVAARRTDIAGLKPPTWGDIVSREYVPWNQARIVIDTAEKTVPQSTQELRQAIARIAGELS
jgi:predicted kinase